MSFLRFFASFFVNFILNFGSFINLTQSSNFAFQLLQKIFGQIYRINLRVNLKQVFLVVFLFSLVFNSIFSTFPILAFEGIDSVSTCGENTISIEKIVTPGAFFPVIPCAVKDGKVQPLSPALIPDILIRAFGLIASLTFYLFSGILILSGVMFIWDGIDGQSRKKAERNIYDTLWALVLIFGTYSILITILTLLKFDFDKTKMKFFDFGTN